MGRRLLVAHEDVADPRLLEQRVVDRQHRAARIAENTSTPWSISAWMTTCAPLSCVWSWVAAGAVAAAVMASLRGSAGRRFNRALQGAAVGLVCHVLRGKRA